MNSEAATKIAPMANYPGDGFATCTESQWKLIPTDYRGSETVAATDTVDRHRVRKALGVYLSLSDMPPTDDRMARENYRHRYHNAFITDAKWVDPPKTPDKPEPAAAQFVAEMAAELRPQAPVQVRREQLRDERIPSHETLSAMKQAAKEGVKIVVAPQLFPTPPDLAARMVELAEIEPGHRILEPSAGTGNMLDAIANETKRRDIDIALTAVEVNYDLCQALYRKGVTGEVYHKDFLETQPERLANTTAS